MCARCDCEVDGGLQPKLVEDFVTVKSGHCSQMGGRVGEDGGEGSRSAQGWRGTRLFVVRSNYSNTPYPQ